MNKLKPINGCNYDLISGILITISFISAIFIANIDSLQEAYKRFVFCSITLGYDKFIYKIPLIQLVNDVLMTLFFLLIGLELKFHLVQGEFKQKSKLTLPSIAAIGGVTVPALAYCFFNFNSPENIKGWAIPIATDTAFMLGILSFFVNFISKKLRAFIIGFSIIDDAIALLILAFFYSTSSNSIAIMLFVFLTFLLFLLNKLKITSSFYYLLIGLFLWIAMVKSGIHGTLSGVVVALAIPFEHNGVNNTSFHNLEDALKPLVYFLILPLFAFINSGVSFDTFSLEILKSPLALGIIWGLFIGKQVGIFLFSYIAVKFKLCCLPEKVSWPKFYGIAVLGGVGFTLSLFIGDLTFETASPNYIMRISVIIGSLLSALFSIAILKLLYKVRSLYTKDTSKC